MILIKKKPSLSLSSFIPKITSLSSILHLSFSSSSQDQNPPPNSHFVASCGFSSQRATTVSKHVSDLPSEERPDSVRHFLKHLGCTDGDIRSVISRNPRILAASVNQTLEPNVQSLTQLGFAGDELRQLVVCNPQALVRRSIIPHVEFWKTLWNGDMKKLLLAFRRNRTLINLDIEKNVIPKIALLKGHGLSDSQIAVVLCRNCRLSGISFASIDLLLKRVQELGFDPGSPMFVSAFVVLASVGPELFKTKMKLFKSFGWTEGEFTTAMRRNPFFITLSEENISEKISFLTERAGCTQSYIASHPKLMNFSLKKRLMPRLRALEILAKSEAFELKPDISCIMNFSEDTFMKRIILPYEEVVPTLEETYVAACSGQL